MRSFSRLTILHTYGTVPQWVTSGAVAASAEHYTTDRADGASGRMLITNFFEDKPDRIAALKRLGPYHAKGENK